MLQDKVFVITGGARGIGLAIYKACHACGARVVIGSVNKEEIKAAIKSVDREATRSAGLVIDVSKARDCQKLINFSLKKFGKIDVLVNNAGIYGPIGTLETNNLLDWQKAIEVNLLGTVFCSRAVLPTMKAARKGKIINLAGAGVGGARPLARFTAYYTSKIGVVGFTEALAKEVQNDKIQVNCISPGAVNTFLTDYLLAQGVKKAGKEMYAQAKKQKESGGDSPDLTAKMVIFLASSAADRISGKIISAKWDKIGDLSKPGKIKDNLYNLRRIDNNLFYEK